MSISRRSFFGLAAGIVAGAAGVAQASPVTHGLDLADGVDRSVVWIPATDPRPRHWHWHENSLADPAHTHSVTFAADLPPFPPIRSIDIHMTRERAPAPKPRPVSQKEFEHRLSSPIGKGRLE